MASSSKTILAVSFLDMMSIGLIVPQMQQHAQSLGCSYLLIGAISAAYSATQLISGPIIGNLSDMKGRKRVLLFTLAVCGVAYLLLGMTTSVLLFICLRSILGIFKQTQMLLKSMAPDAHGPGDHSALFGKLATLAGLGMSVGPMASGHIMELYPDTGFAVITVVVAGLFAVNACLVSSLSDTLNKTIPKNKKSGANASPSSFKELIRKNFQESVEEFKKVNWPVYWDAFLYRWIMTMSVSMYFSNYSLFLRTKHEVSPKNLGYIVAFQGGIGSFCTYFIDHINIYYKNDTDASRRTLHVFIAMTLSFIAMGLAPTIHTYILFVIPLAVSGAVGRVSNLEMIVSKGHDEHRGSVMGATSSVRSMSGIVTPILVGALNEYIGVSYVIFFAAMFSAVGVVISYLLRTRRVTEKFKIT